MPALPPATGAMGGLLLAVNTGSSSVKLDLFRRDAAGQPERLVATTHSVSGQLAEPHAVIELLRRFLASHKISQNEVKAVAHRLVHGGNLLRKPAPLTAALDAQLDDLAGLAPLHNPLALQWLRCCQSLFGDGCVQLLVPDTGFFADMPQVARQYALPRDLSEVLGLHRYGFHGLAHEFMWQAWCAAGQQALLSRSASESASESPAGLPSRLLSLQLGAGCSITATLDGKPQDTSMGFTPLEGLVMASRCGDLDAGLVLWLQRQAGMSVDAIERLLNNESGLYGLSGGVSGGSAAMEVLLSRQDVAAKAAVDLYVYRLRKYLGAYMAVLGGVDGIMFGGGVGEHAPLIRAAVLQGMAWAGIELDEQRNAALLTGSGLISAPTSAVKVLVCQVDEAQLLAQRLSTWLAADSGFLASPD